MAIPQSNPDADRIAWNGLIARHQRAVLNALLSRAIRVDRAKDLAQAAWGKLWERREGIAQLDLPGLAIRQALFLAADERRAASKHDLFALGTAPEAVAPDAHALSRQQLRQIKTELHKAVPSMQRVFFLAHNGEGLSHAEIALQAGLSVQRVRQILCELRGRFRRILDEDAWR